VGRFDWAVARKAISINRPTRIAINGLDYLDYTNLGLIRTDLLSQRTRDFIGRLEQEFGVPASFLGVGPALNNTIYQTGDIALTVGVH
jgi:adenylosuccinate synthase